MERKIYLSEEDTTSIEACRIWADELTKQGKHEEARLEHCNAARIINRSTIQAIQKKEFHPDEEIPFIDLPAQATRAQGIELMLHLLVGSDLYNDITQVLQKHQEGQS